MVLKLETNIMFSLEELWDMACAKDVYKQDTETGIWKGAYHDPLVEMIEEQGFQSKRQERMTGDSIMDALARHYLVIASVRPEIRFLDDTPSKKIVWHMVFLYGYDTQEGGIVRFTIHNSAGFASLNSQIAVRVPRERFEELFSGRAILIRRPF